MNLLLFQLVKPNQEAYDLTIMRICGHNILLSDSPP